jgi:hypothetical protein
MKIVDRITTRLPERLRRKRATAVASPPAKPAGGGARAELVQRRNDLAREVAELQFDLGGLAYEMAIRDHFRLDVIVRRAAMLQERDTELAELDRQVRLEDAGAAGACKSCGAFYARGAAFCWQCGATLVERADTSALDAPHKRTNGHVSKALATPPTLDPDPTTHGGSIDPS